MSAQIVVDGDGVVAQVGDPQIAGAIEGQPGRAANASGDGVEGGCGATADADAELQNVVVARVRQPQIAFAVEQNAVGVVELSAGRK